MNKKLDKELGVVQDPLQQEDIIEHPWVGDVDVKPGSISMGVGWPVKVNPPEEDMEKDY